MKTLYIIRHAKSDWDDPQASDYERTLNKRGLRDAPFMGKYLAGQGVKPDVLLASTAPRAFTTAQLIAKELQYPEDDIVGKRELYLSDEKTLLKNINALPDSGVTAMVVAHNPGVSNFVNYLTGEFMSHLPTCGIVRIDFKATTWAEVGRGTGTLISYDYPKKFEIA
ncbi:MAG: histidine phosphatase family protein [Candidatus Kapabacteria bacterium]|nr:histidine phosphatase family protein [Candidatus Kapabacteria bacterium]